MNYPKFKSIPRLRRDIVITEKIDGTNGLIFVYEPGEDTEGVPPIVRVGDFLVAVGSRSRWITPADDNFGFAAWVLENAEDVVAALGAGMHYGEWWGHGIQRGYGLAKGDRRFSLFNTKRWGMTEFTVRGLGVVPCLDLDTFGDAPVNDALFHLSHEGSVAARGFMNPEGIVVYHTAANQMFKVTLENDDVPKSLVKSA